MATIIITPHSNLQTWRPILWPRQPISAHVAIFGPAHREGSECAVSRFSWYPRIRQNCRKKPHLLIESPQNRLLNSRINYPSRHYLFICPFNLSGRYNLSSAITSKNISFLKFLYLIWSVCHPSCQWWRHQLCSFMVTIGYDWKLSL